MSLVAAACGTLADEPPNREDETNRTTGPNGIPREERGSLDAGRPTLEQNLCASADWVFVGTVTGVSYTAGTEVPKPAPNVIVTEVFTTAAVEPETILHGQPPNVVEISVPGGVIDDVTMSIGGTPEFKAGDRYLFFVSHTPSVFGRGSAVRRVDRVAPEFKLPDDVDWEAVWGEHCGVGAEAEARTREESHRLLSQLSNRWRAYLRSKCDHL